MNTRRFINYISAVALFLFLTFHPVFGGTIYVDANATGANNGSSWSNACIFLQDALAFAASNPNIDEIRIADGTYLPDANSGNPQGTGSVSLFFQMLSGVTIRGGFGGCGEPDPNLQDFSIYLTILSGDLNGDDPPVTNADDLLDNTGKTDNCYAVVKGSGVDSSAVLEGVTITGGYAWYRGGGMYNNGGSPTLRHCVFLNNFAEDYGGAMINIQSNAVITDCNFICNAADGSGAAIYNTVNSPVTLTNCIFNNNYASSSGGGICNYNNSSSMIRDCRFENNYAYFSGGAMDNDSSSPLIVGCKFIYNDVYYDGGAIGNDDQSSPDIINCSFIGNTSKFNGAGVYNDDGSNPTIINCLFSGNEAYYNLGNGGGVCNNNYNLPCSPVIINCIFANNTAQEGWSIYNYSGCNPTLTNCILWYNAGGAEEDQIYGGNPVVNYCCIKNYSGSGTGNITQDPLFIGAKGPDNAYGSEDDNLHLLSGSPCIDRGSNIAVPADIADLDNDANLSERTPLDLYSNPRFVDDASATDYGVKDLPDYPYVVDMGTYEYDPNQTCAISGFVTGELGGIEGVTLTTTNNGGSAVTDSNGYYELTVYKWWFGKVTPQKNDYNFEPPYLNYPVLTADLNDQNYLERVGTVFYVDDDVPLGGDGTSWIQAFTCLQDALQIAVNKDEIRIAQGTYCPDEDSVYYPDGSGSRYANFRIEMSIKIYGGYAGYGIANPNKRDTIAYPTILSGDLNQDDYTGGNTTDNSYNIISLNSLADANTIIDGVTICGGNSTSTGAGVSIGYGKPTFNNCIICDNTTTSGGAGVYIRGDGGNPVFTNCKFLNNHARIGAAAYNYYKCKPTFINCLFVKNTATETGGAMLTYFLSDLKLVNCTFTGNSAPNVNCLAFGFPDFSFAGGSSEVSNCILWNGGGEILVDPLETLTVVNSNIQGGWSGTGNINQDPCFLDSNGYDNTLGTADDNLKLNSNSPCIDAGDNTAVTVTNDTDNRARIVDGDCNGTNVVDMGAYEFSYTYLGDFAGGCDIDFVDFAVFASAWLTEESQGGYDPNCDIAVPYDKTINEKDLQVFIENWLLNK